MKHKQKSIKKNYFGMTLRSHIDLELGTYIFITKLISRRKPPSKIEYYIISSGNIQGVYNNLT